MVELATHTHKASICVLLISVFILYSWKSDPEVSRWSVWFFYLVISASAYRLYTVEGTNQPRQKVVPEREFRRPRRGNQSILQHSILQLPGELSRLLGADTGTDSAIEDDVDESRPIPKALEDSFSGYADDIVHAFIWNWFWMLSDDSQFPNEIKTVIKRVLKRITLRCMDSRINMTSFLLTDAVRRIRLHLERFTAVQRRAMDAPYYELMDLTEKEATLVALFDEMYGLHAAVGSQHRPHEHPAEILKRQKEWVEQQHSVQPRLLEQAQESGEAVPGERYIVLPKPAVAACPVYSTSERRYLRLLISSVLVDASVLPREYRSAPGVVQIAREVLVTKVLEPVMNFVDPDWINQGLAKIPQKKKADEGKDRGGKDKDKGKDGANFLTRSIFKKRAAEVEGSQDADGFGADVIPDSLSDSAAVSSRAVRDDDAHSDSAAACRTQVQPHLSGSPHSPSQPRHPDAHSDTVSPGYRPRRVSKVELRYNLDVLDSQLRHRPARDELIQHNIIRGVRRRSSVSNSLALAISQLEEQPTFGGTVATAQWVQQNAVDVTAAPPRPSALVGGGAEAETGLADPTVRHQRWSSGSMQSVVSSASALERREGDCRASVGDLVSNTGGTGDFVNGVLLKVNVLEPRMETILEMGKLNPLHYVYSMKVTPITAGTLATWTKKYRFSEIHEFSVRLQKAFGDVPGSVLPEPRKVDLSLMKDFVFERMRLVQGFVDVITSHPLTRSSKEVWEFFKPPQSTWQTQLKKEEDARHVAKMAFLQKQNLLRNVSFTSFEASKKKMQKGGAEISKSVSSMRRFLARGATSSATQKSSQTSRRASEGASPSSPTPEDGSDSGVSAPCSTHPGAPSDIASAAPPQVSPSSTPPSQSRSPSRPSSGAKATTCDATEPALGKSPEATAKIKGECGGGGGSGSNGGSGGSGGSGGKRPADRQKKDRTDPEKDDDADVDVDVDPAMTAELYRLVDELFSLNQESFMRKQALVLAKKLVLKTFGTSINRLLVTKLSDLFEQRNVVLGLGKLRDILWPKGIFFLFAPTFVPRVRTPDMKAETKSVAEARFLSVIPASILSIIGPQNCQFALMNVFEMLNCRLLLRHLGYEILDSLVTEAFPELAPQLATIAVSLKNQKCAPQVIS